MSPVSGRLDAFEWRAPMERIGALIEAGDEPPEVGAPAIAAPADPPSPVQEDSATQPILAPAAVQRSTESDAPANVGGGVAHSPAPAPEAPAGTDGKGHGSAIIPSTPAEVQTAEPEPMHMPDDPGVQPEDEAEKRQRRFRLF